jgi:hypothetical protein
MGVAMRLIKIMLASIILVTTGFICLACPRPREVRPPEVAQFKVVAELAKTQYQVGEEIPVNPYIINMGKQPITIWGGAPIIFVRVYDAENRAVLRLPVSLSLDILAPSTLEPQVPHGGYPKVWWQRVVEKPYEEMYKKYTFTLEQPGRYKIVAWADFALLDPVSLAPLVRPGRMLIYADPIWIEVVNGSN